MHFWIIVGIFGLLAILPTVIQALRSRWGSPELRATLHAVGIAIVLDAIPLIFCLIRGTRSPKK